MRLALDPYHDTSVQVSGAPTGFPGKTVVMPVKKQMTITAPASADGGNWDCFIANMPFCICKNTANTNTVGAMLINIDNANYPSQPSLQNNFAQLGALTAFTGSAGTTLFGSSTATVNGLDYCDQFQGPTRLVGGGFEVANTTAEINLQGSVTVFKTPLLETDDYLMLYTPNQTGSVFPYPVTTACGYPISLSQAVTYPSSLTWNAKEGCYVPFVLSDDFRMQMAAYKAYTVQNSCVTSSVPLATPDPSTSGYLTGGFDTNLGVDGWTPVRSMKNNQILTGAYFAGLSTQTTLTVNVTWYLEIAPSASSQFVSLVSDAAQADVMAIQTYQRAARLLPAGCLLSMNPLGEWFSKVANAVGAAAKGIGTVISMIPTPATKAIGGALVAAGTFEQKLIGGAGGTSTAPDDGQAQPQGRRAASTNKSTHAGNRGRGRTEKRLDRDVKQLSRALHRSGF
jgi:hypothetical protein